MSEKPYETSEAARIRLHNEKQNKTSANKPTQNAAAGGAAGAQKATPAPGAKKKTAKAEKVSSSKKKTQSV